MIGKSVPPINSKPVYLNPSTPFDFIAVDDLGEYQVLNLFGSKRNVFCVFQCVAVV